MANPVPRKPRIPIGGIETAGNAARAQESLDFVSRAVDQGPYETIRGYRIDSGQSRQTGASQQAEEHRFGLIVARMAERDAIRHPAAHQLEEEASARPARGLLQIPRGGTHLSFRPMERHAHLGRHRADEALIFLRCLAAQLVVEVRNRRHSHTEMGSKLA